MQLLARNRVKDFDTWRVYYEAQRGPAEEYGLKLVSLWQSKDDPNNVFFLFDVEDVAQADAFMARPESQEIGRRSGVIDGEYHYIQPV